MGKEIVGNTVASMGGCTLDRPPDAVVPKFVVVGAEVSIDRFKCPFREEDGCRKSTLIGSSPHIVSVSREENTTFVPGKILEEVTVSVTCPFTKCDHHVNNAPRK